MARKVYEVAPSGNEWRLRARDGSHSSTYRTKEEAVTAGRRVAQANQPSQLIIKKADGTIETEHTYGNDPFPPRG